MRVLAVKIIFKAKIEGRPKQVAETFKKIFVANVELMPQNPEEPEKKMNSTIPKTTRKTKRKIMLFAFKCRQSKEKLIDVQKNIIKKYHVKYSIQSICNGVNKIKKSKILESPTRKLVFKQREKIDLAKRIQLKEQCDYRTAFRKACEIAKSPRIKRHEEYMKKLHDCLEENLSKQVCILCQRNYALDNDDVCEVCKVASEKIKMESTPLRPVLTSQEKK